MEQFEEKFKHTNKTWMRQDDECLCKYISILCRKYSIDPFRLNYQHLCDFALINSIKPSGGSSAVSIGLSSEVIADDLRACEANVQVIYSLKSLLITRSCIDVVLRMIFLVHLNDSVLPLLSMIAPYSSYSGDIQPNYIEETPANYPGAKINEIRTLLFPCVSDDMINFQYCQIIL